MTRATNSLIYLDSAATMPIDKRVVSAMTTCLNNAEVTGNPSSLNYVGRNAMHDIEMSS